MASIGDSLLRALRLDSSRNVNGVLVRQQVAHLSCHEPADPRVHGLHVAHDPRQLVDRLDQADVPGTDQIVAQDTPTPGTWRIKASALTTTKPRLLRIMASRAAASPADHGGKQFVVSLDVLAMRQPPILSMHQRCCVKKARRWQASGE